MLKIRSFFFSFIAFVSLSACDDNAIDKSTNAGDALIDDSSIISMALYETPPTNLPRRKSEDILPDVTPLMISATGNFEFDGEQIRHPDLHGIFEHVRGERLGILGVSIDPETPFSEVVDRLAMTANYGSYRLLDLEPDAVFSSAEQASSLGESSMKFRGQPGEYAFGAVVNHLAEHNICVLASANEIVNPNEIYDASYAKLDNIVEQAGGVEELYGSKIDILESFKARVQAEANTPWRCVARAAYNIERAGWPLIQFELIEP